MKSLHLLLLGAMLMSAPQVTQAQVAAGPATGGNMVTAHSSVHASIDWAKERLDEMDATLASTEKRLGNVESANRVAAEHAIADMREQRDALKQVIKAQRDASEAEWQQTQANLESRFVAFEAAVQKWVDANSNRVAEQNRIFTDRAEVQHKAWQEMVGRLEASAKGLASDRKRDIDSAAATIRADAEATSARLLALKGAGQKSGTALTAALAESRAAFDRANQTAYEAIKRANS